MNNKLLKNIGIYAGILLLFIGLSYGFTPEVLSGKIVDQGDISQWKGMANEAMTHNEAHPEDPTAWSNSMFGGMPTTATIDSFEGDYTDGIYDFLLTGKRPASYLLIALIGGFLLMLSLGTSKLIAVGGAIAMAFCSYNFQIITAGHNTKMQAIAYFPWVLAGIIFTYKAAMSNREGGWKSWLPKTILGATLFAFALSMQIKANHVQITYYLAIVILAFVIGLFIYLCIDRERRSRYLRKFFYTSALVLVIGLVGIATNANKLLPTLEYSKYTMRGGSELTSDNKDVNNEGLSIRYATEGWSYGIEEMPNLMIPNYNGGASFGELGENSETGKFFDEIVRDPDFTKEIVKQSPLYYGPQKFTAGPMYMGAITVFLFILGIILCKGREKWWLIAATIIAVFLAWGEFFMGFTEFWFDYAPMYNKFRTVSMALIVLQITLPMLGFYVLDKIFRNHYEKKKVIRASAIALTITVGFSLLSIKSPGDARNQEKDSAYLQNVFGASEEDLKLYGIDTKDFYSAIEADRIELMKDDAQRSIWLILIAAALILIPHMFTTEQYIRKFLAGVIVVLVLFDMWNIGKRYLNEDNFVTQGEFSQHYNPTKSDQFIIQDPDPNFRVLDIPRFATATPSYHHKCIGGYSAVKMQRYQDLLDSLIMPEIYGEFNNILGNAYTYEDIEKELYRMDIVSMLNAKYLVYDNNQYPIYNPYAYGNCWFVDDYVSAETPDEELQLLREVNLRENAVIGKDFKWAREKAKAGSSTDDIYLTHYAPNELRYSFSTDSERAAIFSEIYYPKGWKAWIEPKGQYGKVVDGHYQPTSQAREVDIFRANWILRGVVIPDGEGELIMRFEPESYDTGETVSSISSILLILLLLGSAGYIGFMKYEDYKKRRIS